MNIAEQLYRKYSKENIQLIANYVLERRGNFDELMKALSSGETIRAQRAAWVVGIVGKERPDWLTPYFDTLIELLNNPLHPAVSRNVFRALEDADIPEEYEGEILELAIEELQKANTPVAVKVFAMTVATHIALKYPDLCDELALVIENQLPYGSAGYKSRANKMLKKLRST